MIQLVLVLLSFFFYWGTSDKYIHKKRYFHRDTRTIRLIFLQSNKSTDYANVFILTMILSVDIALLKDKWPIDDFSRKVNEFYV